MFQTFQSCPSTYAVFGVPRMIPTQLTEEPILITADSSTNQPQCFIAYRQDVIMKQEVMITE